MGSHAGIRVGHVGSNRRANGATAAFRFQRSTARRPSVDSEFVSHVPSWIQAFASECRSDASIKSQGGLFPEAPP